MFLSKDTAPPKRWYIHIILLEIDEKDVHAEWCCFAKFRQTAVSRDMQAYAYRTHVAKPMRDLQLEPRCLRDMCHWLVWVAVRAIEPVSEYTL